MGQFTNIKAKHNIHRQLARCLFLLGILLTAVHPAAAQTGAPTTQSSLIPLETWVMMGVVVAGLIMLAMKLFVRKLTSNN